MHPRHLLALDETPIELFAATTDGTLRVVTAAIVDNLGASAATCYLKIWTGRDTAPNPASHAPSIVLPVPEGDRQWAPFVAVPGRSWIAVTTEAGLGATAPADVVNALIVWDRA